MYWERHPSHSDSHAYLRLTEPTRDMSRCNSPRALTLGARLREGSAQLAEGLHDRLGCAGGVHLGALVRLGDLQAVPRKSAREALRHQRHGRLEGHHLRRQITFRQNCQVNGVNNFNIKVQRVAILGSIRLQSSSSQIEVQQPGTLHNGFGLVHVGRQHGSQSSTASSSSMARLLSHLRGNNGADARRLHIAHERLPVPAGGAHHKGHAAGAVEARIVCAAGALLVT